MASAPMASAAREPAKLPQLAANHRSPRQSVLPGSLDQGRSGNGPVPEDFAIRANRYRQTCQFLCRSVVKTYFVITRQSGFTPW